MINTATTIVTFVMESLTQNTQDRDTQAIQIELDEPIRHWGRKQHAAGPGGTG